MERLARERAMLEAQLREEAMEIEMRRRAEAEAEAEAERVRLEQEERERLEYACRMVCVDDREVCLLLRRAACVC